LGISEYGIDIMNHTRLIVIGAFMATIAAMFQMLPVLLSEVFVLLTIVSAIPIYIAARLKPFSGILSYIVAFALIFLFSTHQSFFFLCTNGIAGLSLGLCRYYKLKRLIIILISSFSMTITLCIMNYGIGIPVFGAAIPGILIIQVLLIFLFTVLYNFLYLIIADAVYKRLRFTGIDSET
jgi:hypothetical protein